MRGIADLSEPVFSGDNQFIIREAGPDIYTGAPFRTKGGAILICTQGTCKIYIDTEIYNLTEDCECLILPEKRIFFSECSNDLRITIFCFSEDMLSLASRKFSQDFFSHIFHTPVYRHSNNTEITTHAYMSLLELTYKDKRNKYRINIATNILRSFLLHVYDKIQKYELTGSKGISANRAEELYNEFMTLIYEHGMQHHDVAFYADKLCITTRYLAAVTSAVANESPKQTIASYLIQEIKILLTFSELTLQQISDRLNFPDQSHLGRFFKQRTGISPISYRKQNETQSGSLPTSAL